MTQVLNQYLHYVIDLSYQGVYRHFVLPYEDAHQTSYKEYFFPTVEIKDYVMIDGRNLKMI